LQRYDGAHFVLDIATVNNIPNFTQWINKKTTKNIDDLGLESYQIAELAKEAMLIVFVDSSADSNTLLQSLNELTSQFDYPLKVFKTATMLSLRKPLGVTWDSLPSMSFNTVTQAILPYPKNKKFTKQEV